MGSQIAVLAQVQLARQQYENAYRLLDRADSIYTVDQRIFEHSKSREDAATKGRLDLIFSNTSAIVSLLRRYQALSQLYAASSRIQSTLGLEPEIASLNDTSLADLRRSVENAMDQWNRGEALKAPAAPQADTGGDGERAPAADAGKAADGPSPATAPLAASGYAWSNVTAAQPLGQTRTGAATLSIADLHERSMGQVKRAALAAIAPTTAP